jgi:hypothetical protein
MPSQNSVTKNREAHKMGRRRVYANAAARVRAYRSRIALMDRPPEAPSGSKPSCPAQVAEIEQEIRSVLAECQAWSLSLPPSIKGTVQADMLKETIALLAAAADDLARAHPAGSP